MTVDCQPQSQAHSHSNETRMLCNSRDGLHFPPQPPPVLQRHAVRRPRQHQQDRPYKPPSHSLTPPCYLPRTDLLLVPESRPEQPLHGPHHKDAFHTLHPPPARALFSHCSGAPTRRRRRSHYHSHHSIPNHGLLALALHHQQRLNNYRLHPLHADLCRYGPRYLATGYCGIRRQCWSGLHFRDCGWSREESPSYA